MNQSIHSYVPATSFQSAFDADGNCQIDYIAQTLGHGSKLVERMKADHILTADALPYQKHINAGYFDMRDGSPCVTGKGQIWLARKYPAGSAL